MTTLGQMLRANANPNLVVSDAAEAQRVEDLRQSFVQVTEKAKKDIARAIRKGNTPGNVNSHVTKRETCFSYLNGALIGNASSRLRNLDDRGILQSIVAPVWEAFLAWAESEQLSIRLQGWTTRVDGVMQQTVLIKAALL